MEFNWLSFQINLPSLVTYIQSLMTTTYDGLVCDQNGFTVMGLTDPTIAASIQTYLNGLTQAGEEAKAAPAQIQAAINAATDFGNSLIVNYSVQNVLLGISQSGMTQAVTDYGANLQRYLTNGTLYAAIDELNTLIAAGAPSNLAPYVTNDILYSYLNQIQTWLEIAVTPNPGP
jgi:hypothetical protein